MAEDFNNKALRGSISQILLNALVSGDKYGYEICKDIEQKSNGKLMLKQPSLYSSLRRMEGQGLITSYWADSELGGRRHYYSITEKGKKHYEKKQVNWNDFGDLINALPSSQEDSKNNSEVLQQDILSDDKTVNKSNQGDFGILKQEDLFSISKAIPVAKQDISANGETFIQFDMFDQKPNFIKTTNEQTNEVFSTFKSKYSTLTGSIEPDETESNTESFKADVVNQLLATEIKKEQEDLITEQEDNSTFTEETTKPFLQQQVTNFNDIDLNSFEEDFVQSSNNTLLSKVPTTDIIIDNSSKYKPATRDFDNYSFIDKQQQEKYVPNTGKFAYTKNSENIYGGDFSSIESESLKGSLSDFLETDETANISFTENQTNDISSLFKFSSEDNSDVFVSEDNLKDSKESKATIDDIIPKPKPLDEYDEVLKDDERIDVPLYTGSKISTMEFVNSEDNGSFIKKIDKKQSDNYKNKIADLYTDTSKINPYDKPLEQEKISLDSEELFESPKQTFKPNFSSDLEALQEDLGNDGIKLRIYNKTAYTKIKQDNYINFSLLSLIKGWLVWFIMLSEIVLTATILHKNQLLPTDQTSFYFWATGLTLLYPLYFTLAYFLDPYKKVSSTFKLNISLFNKFLAMLINIIFIFAINLFFGMTSLNQLTYLSYWLLPIILSSNYIISTLIYYILLKSKKFSI